MKHIIKKLLAVLLVAVISTAGFGYAEAPLPKTEADARERAYREEFSGAVSRGLVPSELQGSYDLDVTFRQFCNMLENMIKLYDKALLPKWQAASKKAAVSDKIMLRQNGMLALYLAAEVMGIQKEANCNWGITNEMCGERWNELKFDYPLFPQWKQKRTFDGIELNDAMTAAYFFSMGRKSLSDFKTVFEADEQKRSMRTQDKLTRAEAIRAVVRLYDSVPRFRPVAEAVSNTVSKQAKEAALALPKAIPGKLPDWHGTAMEFKATPTIPTERYFIAEDFEKISAMGFNYVRLHYSYKHFVDEQVTKADMYVLENLDRVVEWGAKYGVHINIVLYELPGSRDDIMSSDLHFKQAVKVWSMLAERYSDVPANVLSYNLLNEPDIGGVFTEESYGRLANSLVEAIRKYDGDKLILSDGMLNGNWFNWEGACSSMPNKYLKNDIVQTIHFYPWNMVRKSAHINLLKWPYEHRDTVNNMITTNGEPLTLRGSFDAGSEITLSISGINNVNAGIALLLQADGKEGGRCVLDGVKEGKDNCSALYQQQERPGEYSADFGNNGFYDGWKLSFKLKEKAKELKISLDSQVDGTVAFREIFIKIPANTISTYAVPDNTKVPQGFSYETGSFRTVYIYCSEVYGEPASTVTIAEDGSYTAIPEYPGHDSFDYETMRQYFRKWKEWSIETGTPISCNEFAPISALPKPQRIAFLKATLELLKEFDIPWAITVSNMESWGPFMFEEEVRGGRAVLPYDGSYIKTGSMYIDQPALELLRSYKGE